MAANPPLIPFRLPGEAEIRRILADANRAPAGIGALDTPQGKARRNLYKGIDWAYKGLPPNRQVDANIAYKQLTNSPAADLGDFVRARGDLPADEVVAAVRALVQTESQLSHSGHDRYRELTKPELQTIDHVLTAIAQHIKEIEEGRHDGIVNRLFPLDVSVPEIGTAEEVRQRVLLTFKKGFEAVSEYRRYAWVIKPVNLRVDSYADPISAGGLTNREDMKLAQSFFTNLPRQMEAALLHESTHAIKDETWRTGDEGGYIGSAKFQTAVLSERVKNAAHYEAVIRLINGEHLAVPDNAVMHAEALKAQETLRRAWDKAQALYTWVQGMGAATIKRQDNLRALRDIAWLFGLSGYQGLAGLPLLPERSVTVADLASLENRVRMLAELMRSAQVVAAVDALNRAGITLTERDILLKVIERAGTIRKGANAEKTLDLLDVLAKFSEAKVDAFKTKYPGK